ncbi:MAG: hypothetical protein HYZ29_19315 [Myxococcales bacterium]|nr:hypothetical protein [Myxococcales bacterium]
MSRRAVAFVFGLGVFGAASASGGGAAGGGGLPVAVAHAEETAESCLSFKKGDLEKGISFDIESSCGMKLACKVSWVVQCSDNDGKVESRSSKVETFGLAGSESHRVEMSGASCKQAWRVDDVKWGCDPVKK